MRARSVFTATTISPSPPLRQRSACYTIRARRNFALVPVFRQGADYSFSALAGTEPACDGRSACLAISPLARFSRYGVPCGTSHGITLPSTSCPCTTQARASPLSAGTGLRVLTRQGISLIVLLSIATERQTISPCMSPCRWDHLFICNDNCRCLTYGL